MIRLICDFRFLWFINYFFGYLRREAGVFLWGYRPKSAGMAEHGGWEPRALMRGLGVNVFFDLDMAVVTVDVETKGLRDKLGELMTASPRMGKLIRKVVADQLRKARNNTAKDIKQGVGSGHRFSGGDPRQAFRAVKVVNWRDDIGGSISLYNKRRASNQRIEVKRRRKLDENPHQRGGNRRKRMSAKTAQIESYFGSDRAFVLRWLDRGTVTRGSRFGNRGRVNGNGVFKRVALFHLQTAEAEIERQIVAAHKEIFGK